MPELAIAIICIAHPDDPVSRVHDVTTMAKTKLYSGMYVKNLQTGFEEDIEIWENKLYRDRPALCDGDGPIGKLRKWYRRFYAPAPATIGD